MTLVYRKARLADLDALVELSIESVKRDPLPVRIDREAMIETLRVLFNPAHFLWVSERDGVVVAGVAAMVQRSFWYRGLQLSVLLYYTREKGGCMPLLHELSKWMKSRSGIKVSVMELEPSASPAMVRAMRRIGFDRVSTNVCYVRTA